MTTTDPRPEHTILAPRDPSADTNPDDWPEFELTNARVRLPHETDPNANVSLLLASEHYPLTVTGTLQPVPPALAYLHRGSSTKRSDVIEIADVRIFAYGQYADGNVALWAAGKAGWFALKPARGYKRVYGEMLQAIKLLYFVADAYREPRVSGKGRGAVGLPEYSAQEVFEKYAREVMGEPGAIEDAREAVYGHRDFLLVSMMAGKEGLDWSGNALFLHLRKKFAREHAAIVQRLAGPTTGKKAGQAQRGRPKSVESGSTTSSLKRKRGRPAKNKNVDVISLGSSSAARSVVKDVVPQPAEATKARSATQSKPLAVRRTRHNPSAPITETVTETPVVVSEPTVATPTIPEISESDDEEPNGRHAHKGRSVLRPKPSKGSKGAPKSGKGKAPVASDNDDDDDEADDDDDDDEANPRSSPTAHKRKPADDDHPTQARQRKRRSSKQEVDEGIDIPDESPTSSSSPSPPSTSPSPSPAEPSALNHAPDPVQKDTWLCALDGCTHKVYLALEPASQRLIREHYALHAYDDDARVQMVRKLQAPSLPVERLMEKVRARARVEGLPGSRVAGTRFAVLAGGGGY